LLADWKLSGNRLPAKEAPAGDLTISELVVAFDAHAEQHYPPTSRELSQFKLSLRPLRRLYGHTRAADFGPKALKAVQQAMVDGSWMTDEEKAKARSRGQPIGWCRNVVNRRMTRVKTFFKWAESEELVPAATYHALQTVSGLSKLRRDVRHTEEPKPATWDQVEAVLPHCPRPVAAMLQLQWWAGMRSCEVRVVRTRDLDRSDPQCWTYTPSDDEGRPAHKNSWRDNGQVRVIPLGPECQRVLAAWLRDDDPNAFLFSPRQSRAEFNAARRAARKTPLTPSQRARKQKARPERAPGDCYTDNSYAHAVARAWARANVCRTAGQGLTVRQRYAASTRFHPYMLRHGFRMRIGRLEGDETARAMMGQKSIQATQHYGRIDLERAAEAASRLG
jgi:integrase